MPANFIFCGFPIPRSLLELLEVAALHAGMSRRAVHAVTNAVVITPGRFPATVPSQHFRKSLESLSAPVNSAVRLVFNVVSDLPVTQLMAKVAVASTATRDESAVIDGWAMSLGNDFAPSPSVLAHIKRAFLTKQNLEGIMTTPLTLPPTTSMPAPSPLPESPFPLTRLPSEPAPTAHVGTYDAVRDAGRPNLDASGVSVVALLDELEARFESGESPMQPLGQLGQYIDAFAAPILNSARFIELPLSVAYAVLSRYEPITSRAVLSCIRCA